ncbi:MAG: hypothetical protein ACRYFZ_01510 [Janthinobacterium lividum]
MRTGTSFRWLAALVLWLGPLLAAHATHILGGEITYSPVASTTAGVPRYRVATRLYSDPASPATQSNIQLEISQGGCGPLTATYSLLTVPASQSSTTYALGCLGAPGVAYRVQLFETDVNLPPGQWTFSVNVVNRAANLVNLVNSVNSSCYISAFLNNALVGSNTSPKFLSTLLPYLCNGSAQRYSFSTFDSDGDSLVYQFRQPEQAITLTSPTTAACSFAVPGTLSPHFQLNAATGSLTTVPAPVQQGVYAMAARVSEFRRVSGSWQLIGYVTRDISYLAIGSVNETPRFTSLRLNGAANPQPLAQTIRVQPGQAVTLALEAADPDAGQTLRFESQAPGAMPGLSLTTTGATSALLTWQVPATLPLGRYTATVAVLDNGCPNASEEYTFVFLVAPQALAARPASSPAAEAYPTPFREQVQFKTAPNQVVVLFDALGREVARLTSASDGLVRWQPASALPAGLYLARAAADGQPLARLLRAE